jgi:hypothetical protein
MRQDLDALRAEIEDALRDGAFVVFHGESRPRETAPLAYWDTEEYPDFRQFLQTARRLEIPLIVFHHRRFDPTDAEEALDRLEDSEVSRDQIRDLETRLKEMTRYGGFTCAVELSFDYNGRTYIYSARTEWFTEFLRIMREIEEFMEMFEEDEPPMGGYFSNN